MRRLTLLAALLLAALPAQAGEDASAARAAFAAATARLPAPSAALGFDFDGVLRVDGQQAGHCAFRAAPADASGEAPGWVVRESLDRPSAAGREHRVAVARLARDLRPIRGAVEEDAAGGARHAWERTSGGFRVTSVRREGDVTTEEVRNVRHRGPASPSLAARFLLCRLLLDESGVLASATFDSERAARGDTCVDEVTYRVLGLGRWGDGQALRVEARRAGERLTVAFTPGTRALRGARIEEDGGRILEIVAGTRWTLPARDPRTAALRAALGFASGDARLLDQVVFWPRIIDQAQGLRAEGSPPVDAGALRERVLAGWATRLPRSDQATIQDVLLGIEPDLRVQRSGDGRARVSFPEAFEGLELEVGRVDGAWYLVALPGVE